MCKTAATQRHTRAMKLLVLCGATTAARTVCAEPLRLRADAVAEAQAPAGLVILEGQDKVRPWLYAEGLVWTGTRSDPKTDPAADVMVLAVRLRDPRGFGEIKGGRFVVSTGAVRPVQIDGAHALGRAPWQTTTLEAFAGAPVVPRFGTTGYDWLGGGRVAQTLASRATLGASYVQRRSHKDIADDEIGADLAAVPVPWLDLAGRSAYDLTSPGIADALASAAVRFAPMRVELFAAHRSPSRLLPATSLFSVLGDFPSQSIGSTVRWEAAPRLDLLASGAGQRVGGEFGGNGFLRALLRTDERGEGSLGLEGRRQDVSTAKWTGLRGLASLPLGHGFRYATEIEIAVPDAPRGRGIAWPWGLVALSWRSASGWEAAGAAEASSTPEHRYQMNALFRVSRTLEIR